MPAMPEVDLWFVRLEPALAALERAEQDTPRLSAECEERISAAADAPEHRFRRAAHIALRLALERRLGPSIRRVPFVRSSTGKPSLPASHVAFSLAHASGVALIAVSDGAPVGVDIETARIVRAPSARRGPIEALGVTLAGGAPLQGDDADTRFLSAWVRLEASAKALGIGLAPLLDGARPPRGAPSAAGSFAWDMAGSPAPTLARDVAAGEGLYAAIALPAGVVTPPLGHVPASPAALAAFAAGHGADRGETSPSGTRD